MVAKQPLNFLTMLVECVILRHYLKSTTNYSYPNWHHPISTITCPASSNSSDEAKVLLNTICSCRLVTLPQVTHINYGAIRIGRATLQSRCLY